MEEKNILEGKASFNYSSLFIQNAKHITFVSTPRIQQNLYTFSVFIFSVWQQFLCIHINILVSACLSWDQQTCVRRPFPNLKKREATDQDGADVLLLTSI